ncbi:Protein ASPARTIC PROTEASE IN GUARD CELL 1 like [Actinidia chinensis var. chinensis]|uniref:Protein ASPARTIC PROTEASE IN GUARD CELL 1 like n=1 Tax=Actinidia chinensis var. chinensis TaxID=1590841 RepID=A0A2R6PH27_ACTCC|nr:Protein ASPARTIC PROTEASE IN GUARD CELL 1 like [Actinidia chinensis var. chinensis]
MAERVLFFFCIFFTLSVTLAVSRSLPDSKTTILDVSNSIQKTVDVFLADLTKSSEIDKSLSSSDSLSFQLHSRSSIHRAHHRDYKSLTLARLGRDSSRAKSLQARLDLAINGITESDLKPVDSVFGEEALEGPVISGTSQGSGEYFSRVGIGRPPSEVYMVLDTGSDVNWVQCAPCADCYQQTDPIYEPASSTSYSPLTCETRQCKSLDVSECRNDSCLYEVSYGDGSYTVGEFVTETITFGGSASVADIAIGCGHNNEGLFVGAAGLIGLGGGLLSFPSQINASSFSYCLVDRDSDSASTLEFDSVTPPNAVTAPLLRNRKLDTFYYLDVTDLSVGGEMLSITPSAFRLDANGDGGVIIDSGTAVTRLQTDAYNSLRDAFVKGTRTLPSTTGVALFDTCYNLSSMKSVEVPTVSFHFSNGKSLSLPAKNYLIPVDSAGTFCFAFAPTSSSLSIIGNVQQQGTRVSFDLANSLIGFSPNTC